ncbi:MAG: chromosomal replication initiator protein DnaA [Patescibacteria group bacterium]
MTDQKDLWRAILQKLEVTVPRNHFVTWFQNTGIVNFEADVLVIGFPNAFAKEWVERHYGAKITTLVKDLIPTLSRVVFEIAASFANGDDTKTVPLEGVLPAEKSIRKLPNSRELKIDGNLRSRMLNNRYTLDTFVAGRNNRLPHAACTAVGHQPSGIYNPLFLYGDVGLGKTHLLQATGNEILRNYPKHLIVYITSEHFVNEVIQAIRTRNVKEFKDRYRKVDCLMVDDVQFFCEKSSSQEEFFHTFNDLYDANKQIILTSDRAPKDLEGLDDRLKSRFGMGMVTEVIPPEYETRIAILQNMCQENALIIDQEILSCIAYHVEKSVRDLEGVFKSLMAIVQLQKTVPTLNDALDLVRQLHGAKETSPDHLYRSPNPSRRFVRDSGEILSVVAKYFRLSKEDIMSDDRRKEILIPRQICMYLIRQELNEAYEKIGVEFGGKNHATVLHACNKIVEMLKQDQRLVRDVHEIKKELGL